MIPRGLFNTQIKIKTGCFINSMLSGLPYVLLRKGQGLCSVSLGSHKQQCSSFQQ